MNVMNLSHTLCYKKNTYSDEAKEDGEVLIERLW